LGTGNDEVNLIEFNNNYGWPEIQGDQTRDGMVTPIKNSTPSKSWAPGGTEVIGDYLYFSGLRGQALYRAKIEGKTLTSFEELLKGKYGRIREVIKGPDGMLYITTSNRDGRGVPQESDDRIIRINPGKL
jgi:glucose/arabinose dehydrogenase